MVATRQRNPQHFHRVRTGSAPLRTSHPHVCTQTGKHSSCWRADSSGSARPPVPACPSACRSRAAWSAAGCASLLGSDCPVVR